MAQKTSKADRFRVLLDTAGINHRRVLALGPFVTIDTFAKYEAALIDLFTNAGFKLHTISDGVHLDEINGYRIVFAIA